MRYKCTFGKECKEFEIETENEYVVDEPLDCVDCPLYNEICFGIACPVIIGIVEEPEGEEK